MSVSRKASVCTCGPMSTGRVVVEDPPLQLAELRGGLETELVGEVRPGLLVGAQRLGLAAGAVERQHLLGAEALPQRILLASTSSSATTCAPEASSASIRASTAREPQLLEAAGLSSSGNDCARRRTDARARGRAPIAVSGPPPGSAPRGQACGNCFLEATLVDEAGVESSRSRPPRGRSRRPSPPGGSRRTSAASTALPASGSSPQTPSIRASMETTLPASRRRTPAPCAASALRA